MAGACGITKLLISEQEAKKKGEEISVLAFIFRSMNCLGLCSGLKYWLK